MITSTVDTSIQAVSPLLGTGADAAGAAAVAAEAAGAAAAAAEAPASAADAAAATAGAEAGASAALAAPAKPRTARPRAREAMSFFMGCLFKNAAASERVLAGLTG